ACAARMGCIGVAAGAGAGRRLPPLLPQSARARAGRIPGLRAGHSQIAPSPGARQAARGGSATLPAAPGRHNLMQEQIERLERDITLLSRAITFPEAPSLAARVRSRIEAERRPRARAPSWQLAVKAAVLFYRHSDGTPYALFETNAPVGKGLPIAGKGVLSSSQSQPLRGLGEEAYWLTGLRIVQYYDPSGAVIRDSVRATEENTLLWSANGRVFRIEGNLTQEQAIGIARSLK